MITSQRCRRKTWLWLLAVTSLLFVDGAASLAPQQPRKPATVSLSSEPPSSPSSPSSFTASPSSIIRSIRIGYRQRLAADPLFASKSLTEVFLAASTQLSAEWNRRGASRLLPEIDFVFPAILTAVFGKYYSMWRVAKTTQAEASGDNRSQETKLFGRPVPTNAFQRFMLDNTANPTIPQRLGSFIAPMPPLFFAGILASGVGYSIAALLIYLRTILFTCFQTPTRPVNIIYAALYTGVFMAFVSNIRYQVLQGIIEPVVDRWMSKYPILRSVTTFAIRLANGLLGSVLAISGMRYFGLQKLK